VAVVSHPALSNFSVKQPDVQEAITKVTRGPIAPAEKLFRFDETE